MAGKAHFGLCLAIMHAGNRPKHTEKVASGCYPTDNKIHVLL